MCVITFEPAVESSSALQYEGHNFATSAFTCVGRKMNGLC